jgi:hypothetical protein
MKTQDYAESLSNDDLLYLGYLMNGQGTLVRFIVDKAIRNHLEDIHAGIFPSSKTGDFSDVKVVTPYGEIPWTELSRISDPEMRELMLTFETTIHNTFVGLIPKFIEMIKNGDKTLMARIEEMYKDGVSWDRLNNPK